MTINQTNSRSVTIPWGRNAQIPDEHVETEFRVRDMIGDLTKIAVENLAYQDGATSDYLIDMDPCPNRVMRESRRAHNHYLKAEGDVGESKEDITPSKLILGQLDSGTYSTAKWEDGKMIQAERIGYRGRPDEYVESIKVNANGTLTYTITEQGKC